MKKAILLGTLAACVVVLYSCHKNNDTLPHSDAKVYLDLPDSVHDYTNLHLQGQTNEQITLGRVLFYDRHLSINNSISCGSCHKQAFAFSDNVAASHGFENRSTSRNTPPLQNLGFSGFGMLDPKGSGTLFWDGRERDIKSLITRPITNHVEMGIEDLSSLPTKLGELPYYSKLFNDAYGSSDITLDKISSAVSAFVQVISATNTRFDQASANKISLTALEQQGSVLFNQKYNCGGCHNENVNGYFSGDFMDIGLDRTYKDLGVGAVSGSSADNGKFKVPNLRNVTLTAPYMHDGRFATLEDVLEHYSHGINSTANLDVRLKDSNGQPMKMNIPAQEKQAIIAFLATLTDYNMITDPFLSDPFKTK
jgi:cytochrome c peroxidase